MKITETISARAILALLPVLASLRDFQSAFFLGMLICLFTSLTGLFFQITASLFPKQLIKIALLLWLAVFAQIGWYLWALKPFWAASVFFLLPEDSTQHFFDGPLIVKELNLWAMLLVLGGFLQFTQNQFGWGPVQFSITSFVVLALTVCLARLCFEHFFKRPDEEIRG